jgi:hypothetical protein
MKEVDNMAFDDNIKRMKELLAEMEFPGRSRAEAAKPSIWDRPMTEADIRTDPTTGVRHVPVPPESIFGIISGAESTFQHPLTGKRYRDPVAAAFGGPDYIRPGKEKGIDLAGKRVGLKGILAGSVGEFLKESKLLDKYIAWKDRKDKAKKTTEVAEPSMGTDTKPTEEETFLGQDFTTTGPYAGSEILRRFGGGLLETLQYLKEDEDDLF